MRTRWIGLAITTLAVVGLACSFFAALSQPTATAEPSPAAAPLGQPETTPQGGGAPSPVPPASDPTQRLTLVNHSGATICTVYISPTGDASRGADWLGSTETIANGASRSFDVVAGLYDLRADDCSSTAISTQAGTSITGATTWTLSAAGAPAPTPTQPSATTSLTVYNNSGSTIFYFYISPSTDSSWGSDQLGASTIPVGGSYTFNLANGTYDLKAEDSSHTVIATWMSVSIPPTTSWSVTSSAPPPGTSTSLTVYNNSSTTIFYFYISPSTASSWGSDQLGTSTIAVGGSYTFSLANGTYDLKAEDASHNVIATWMGVSIPPTTSWSVTGGAPPPSTSSSLTVYNNSSSIIFYLYISPSTDSSWGSDQLGASTIPVGGSYTFSLANGTYDLKAEDASHNVIATWFGVPIPPTTSWSVP